MRVAVYHPWIYLKGGAERLILELVRHSRHDWTIVTNRYEPENTFPELRELDIVALREISVERNLSCVTEAALTILSQRFGFERFDALMISSEGLGNLVAFHRHLPPMFCYCHTPLKIAYDRVTREHFFKQRRGLRLRLGIRLFTAVDRMAWSRFEHVFCNSAETYERLLRGRLTEAARTEILHPGVDHEVFKPTGQTEPYFLLPGRIMWTKNVGLAIFAFREFKRTRPPGDPFRLVIAGMVDEKSRSFLDWLRSVAEGEPMIEFVACPDDAAMRELYARSWAVLNTSYNEDWGMTLIEGMASGKAILAVNRGGPTESVIHGTTGFLSPPSPAPLAEYMTRLAKDRELTLQMGRAGLERSRRYRWTAFAERIDACVDGLARPRATLGQRQL